MFSRKNEKCFYEYRVEEIGNLVFSRLYFLRCTLHTYVSIVIVKLSYVPVLNGTLDNLLRGKKKYILVEEENTVSRNEKSIAWFLVRNIREEIKI